jgi:S1-C subfamily serine protease
MDLLDGLLIALAAMAAIGGWRVGFVARAFSWVGMTLGIFLASRILPNIIESQKDASAEALLLMVLAVLLAGGFIGQICGYIVGDRVRVGIARGPARQIDRSLGAVAGVIGVAVAFWLLLPTMADTPGWASQQARGSLLAGLTHDHLPRPPDTVRALRSLVGDDIFPRVLDGLGEAPALGPPPPESGLDPATSARVASSTVLVESNACSKVREGSGAVIGEGLIVTNAHVVAGSSKTRVFRYPDGDALSATIVAFDANRDVAILRVPDIGRPALPLAQAAPKPGDIGAAFGHPGGGPLAVQPYQVGSVVNAIGRDIYDDARTKREVLFLAAKLAPGDSGGALVDPKGVVEGVAFAIAPDQSNVAYALTVGEVRPVLANAGAGAVDPGPCLG